MDPGVVLDLPEPGCGDAWLVSRPGAVLDCERDPGAVDDDPGGWALGERWVVPVPEFPGAEPAGAGDVVPPGLGDVVLGLGVGWRGVRRVPAVRWCLRRTWRARAAARVSRALVPEAAARPGVADA